MPILLILGAGGHGRVVADAALRQGAWSRLEATDRNPAKCSGELLPGVQLVQPDQLFPAAGQLHVAIGEGVARQRECSGVAADRLACVVHPQSSVSPHATMGAGCFVASHAVVAPGAVLGAGVIVNHGAVVDHDVSVGSYSHVAPGATLGGGVQLGELVLVGAGASVLPGLKICSGVVIGAGAVVHRDLPLPGTYAGVPARRIR